MANNANYQFVFLLSIFFKILKILCKFVEAEQPVLVNTICLVDLS